MKKNSIISDKGFFNVKQLKIDLLGFGIPVH